MRIKHNFVFDFRFVMSRNAQINNLGIRIHAIPLPRTSTGEHHPAVEGSRPPFAASAGLDPKIGCRPFNHIAKPYLLVSNKPWQAHTVRRVSALVWGAVTFAFLCHTIHLLAFAVKRDW